jgi:hypothetical protein
MFIPCINGQEGSIGTIIIYFKLFRLFLNLQKEMNSVMVTRKKKKKGKCGKNDKKILEHQFERDDRSGSSFWSWY